MHAQLKLAERENERLLARIAELEAALEDAREANATAVERAEQAAAARIEKLERQNAELERKNAALERTTRDTKSGRETSSRETRRGGLFNWRRRND